MISVVLPVFNEERNLEPLYSELTACLDQLGDDYELIFVNDGSWDGSMQRLRELASADKRVKVIGLSRNFGQQIALSAGMHHARGDACITMDCDLQDPPAVLPEMISRYREGYDVVYARRIGREDGFLKRITAKCYYSLLARVADVQMQRNVGDFRLINRKVLNVLNRLPERHRYLRGIVSWVGFREAFVDFERPNRSRGETGYTWKKMITLATDGLLNFSLFPLKLGMYLGVLSILMGVGFIAYMLVDALLYATVYPLYKWLTVVLFIFVGLLFILLWIMGEYIGRVYNEVKGRPLYIVDEKINVENAEPL